MDNQYESLERLILFVFNSHESAIISTDNIYQYIQGLTCSIRIDNNWTPSTAISKCQIVQALQESDRFVHINRSAYDRWALSLQSTLAISDTALFDMINRLLVENGPLSITQMTAMAEIPDVDSRKLMRFFTTHAAEFSPTHTGTYWFKNTPEPEVQDYCSLDNAINAALGILKEAHPQTIARALCLSTVSGSKITESDVSYQLTHNPDLYQEIRPNIFRVSRFMKFRSSFKSESSESESTSVESSEAVFNPYDFFNDHSPIRFALTV